MKELVTRHLSLKNIHYFQTETKLSWWHKVTEVILRWHCFEKRLLNFQFNTVRAENEFSIKFMSFWLTFSLGIILLSIVKYDRLGESNLKRFVVVASDWPKNKSSESSEQLFTSWTLQVWFVKVISQFYK